jgi:hypothetical protein
MDDDSKQALLEAVNTLIKSPDAQRLYDALVAVIPAARLHPVRLSGDAAVLNALVMLKLKSPDTYDNVLSLVEAKRKAAGFEPLERPVDDRFNKTEYMRNFMDQKRERERRAAKIENMIRPPADALRGRTRLDFMQRQSARWKEDRDMLLEQQRTLAGGAISREVQQQVLDQFWTRIDASLDELEALAAAELRKPTHQRKRIEAGMEQLSDALSHQPYAKEPTH